MNRVKRKSFFSARRKPKPRTRVAKKKVEKGPLISPQFLKSRGFLLLLVLFVFVLILAFFFGEGGILEIVKSRGKIDALRKEITDLEKQKTSLIKEIKELRQNPMALEKKAREKLWLMKKNEKVVVIIDENEENSDKPKESPSAKGKRKPGNKKPQNKDNH